MSRSFTLPAVALAAFLACTGAGAQVAGGATKDAIKAMPNFEYAQSQ
jgi:hypothetical protein